MDESVKWICRMKNKKESNEISVNDFDLENAKKARRFHTSFDAYCETPLIRLKNLSSQLGISEILVKDESYRFGLNAFKVLGGSYAIGNLLAQKLGLSIDEVSFKMLKSKKVKDKLGEITFVTATDGNHGKGVAWVAQQLNQKAVVYMPKGSSLIRLNSIKEAGAQASIINLNYDGAVRFANENAQQYGWQIIQDTAWEGYEDVPKWIMQGYSTLMLEAVEQMQRMMVEKPTHVFVQAGVGSLAGAVQGFLSSLYGEEQPITVVVEPNKADCFYRSAKNNKKTIVAGDMDTIMNGLACGEPNTIGWKIINHYTDAYISCPEYITANGMRILGNPLRGDERVISGESGAVTTGILYSILTDKKLEPLKEELKIDENSRVLVISTEGDTDPVHYRKIVWDGMYSNS